MEALFSFELAGACMSACQLVCLCVCAFQFLRHALVAVTAVVTTCICIDLTILN